jgi:hypothetical protein
VTEPKLTVAIGLSVEESEVGESWKSLAVVLLILKSVLYGALIVYNDLEVEH